MAVHKIPQDVEADDKFLGPLSFKQFLFGGGVVVFGYLSYLTISAGGWFVSFIFIIPALIFAALAFPWSKEQPTELWLAAQIRFRIKPRRRIWDQSGMKELVTITAPVQVAHAYSDGLTQNEVRNRLSALATMVDSRGWAVKNVQANDPDSDRLVSAPIPFDTKTAVVEATPDLFDESNSTIAKQFDNMIEKSEQQHKSDTLRLVEEARNAANTVMDNQASAASAPQTAADSNDQNKSDTLKLIEDARKVASKNSAPEKSGGSSRKHGKGTVNEKNNQDFWFLHQQQQPTDPSLATFQASSVITPGASSGQTTASDDNSVTTDLTEQELLETAHEKHRRDAMQTSALHMRVIDPNGPTNPTQKPEPNIQNPVKATSTMTPPLNPDILNLAQSNDLSVETLSRQANRKKNLDDGEVNIPLR